jgi:protein-S-isoprenylcysteine O-methyltransferase Ste14
LFTGLYQSGLILAVIVTYYLLDFWLISRYDRQRRAEGSGRSWDYTLMIFAAVSAMILQPILLPSLSVSTNATWGALIQIAGVLFALGGLILHTWSRLHLQHFYAERVERQPGHCVVNTGPYAYVRHPVFTSFFMLIIGLFLVNPALPTALMVIYTFWDFSRAARQEEELLSHDVPGYADYMAQTPPFFPKLGVK